MKAKLHCYSPGVSVLHFVWCDHDTDGRECVSGKPIYLHHIKRYMAGPRGKALREQGYEIHRIEGQWTVMKPVERVASNTLKLDGKLFRYRHTYECPADGDLWPNMLRFEFIPPSKTDWWKLRNLSMINQLTHFVRYEHIWQASKPDTDKRIKDSDTWALHKVWPVTVFEDGDGQECTD